MATKIKQLQITDIPATKLPLVIGYFGAVHVMHSQLFYTFHHYNILTFNDFYKKAKSQLYRFNERMDNLIEFNPMNIFVYDIKKHNMKAEDFIQTVLLPLAPSEIVVGTNFKFGSDHAGVPLLRKYFKVITINQNNSISSTKIAQLLSEHKIGTANSYLSKPYYYIGKWVKGKKEGRKLGFPTININVDHNFFLGEGSYITKTTLGLKTYKSVTFVGKSKTFKKKNFVLESHILNKRILPRSLFSTKVRDNVKIEFLSFLRTNTGFKKQKDLIKAISKDKAKAKAYFDKIK